MLRACHAVAALRSTDCEPDQEYLRWGPGYLHVCRCHLHQLINTNTLTHRQQGEASYREETPVAPSTHVAPDLSFTRPAVWLLHMEYDISDYSMSVRGFGFCSRHSRQTDWLMTHITHMKSHNASCFHSWPGTEFRNTDCKEKYLTIYIILNCIHWLAWFLLIISSYHSNHITHVRLIIFMVLLHNLIWRTCIWSLTQFV